VQVQSLISDSVENRRPLTKFLVRRKKDMIEAEAGGLWQGETEGNLECILNLLQAMSPSP
jgi:hypothetical protein